MNSINALDQPPLPGFRLMGHDAHLNHIGKLWVKTGSDEATLLLQAEPVHANANGSVHGGLLMTMLDVVLGMSLDSEVRAEGLAKPAHAITMQLSCNMVGAGAPGDLLVAHGKIDRLTRNIGFVSGRITTGDRLLITGSAVFKRPSPSR